MATSLETIEKAVCLKRGGLELSVIARRLQISRQTVRKYCGSAGRRPRREPVEPRMVSEYICPGCRNMVVYRPCVICAALAFTKERE